MNDNNFYVVHGWMISKLKLKDKELSTFAIIYGFSQDGENVYNGGLSYLEEWTCSSKKTIIETLKKLVEKKYLIKNSKVVNNITFNEYKANIDLINTMCNNYTSGVEITPGVVKKLHQGGVEITPNNINNNIDNNIYISSSNDKGIKEAKKVKKEEQNNELFDKFWEAYPKKRDKQTSRKAFTKLNVDDKLFNKMMASLSQAKNSYDWQKNGGQYIPYPSTWLNGRRWEDELATVSQPQPHTSEKNQNEYNETSKDFEWF